MTTHFRWLLLAALSLMMFLINVDYTAVNLALMPMSAELHADINSLQWVLSAYVLAWGVLVIPAGNFADRYSKRGLCLAGIALFLFASFLAGCAQSIELLIAARVLQGIAGAIFIPTLYALIYIHFAEHERGRAMGIMSLGIGMGLAVGPFIGGVLIELINWRSIFFINIPLGVLAFAIVYLSQKDQPAAGGQNLSKASAFLLGLSLISALYSLGGWRDWSDNIFLYSGLCLLAIIAMWSFIKLQRNLKNPLVPLTLFKNLPFLGISIGMALEQFIFSSIIVVLGLFLQKVMLFSSLKSSLVYLALTVIFSISAAATGPWIDKVGLRLPIITGLMIVAVGTASFQILSVQSQPGLLYLILAIIGLGLGLAFTGLNTGVMKTVEANYVGVASSVFTMFALLGNTLGVMTTAILYQRGSVQSLLHSLTAQNTIIDAVQLSQIAQYIASLGAKTYDLSAFSTPLQSFILKHTANALNIGLHHVMLCGALFCLLAAGICARLISDQIHAK